MNKRILVAVDLAETDTITRLLDVAERLATLDSAELHVLSVIPSYSMPIVGSYFPKEQEAEVLEAARKALQEKLKSRDFAGTLKGHIAHGTIYDEIMRVADKLECDLIVMASHRPEFKDYLLGPNAARVVRHAHQSVYVVRSTV